VAWRLPHWFVVPMDAQAQSLAAATELRPIHAFPRGSTSGDFAQKQLKMLGVSSVSDLDISEFAFAPSGAALTFWPLHEVPDSKVRAVAQFAGPLNEVTVLFGREDTRELIRIVGDALRGVLRQLADTQGLVERMKPFDFANVDSPVKPNWMTDDWMPYLLGAYVRHGCYFPYPLINRAIGRGIEDAVGETANEIVSFAKRFASRARGHFRRQMGVSPTWDDLSYDERLQAQRAWGVPDAVEREDRQFWDAVRHGELVDANLCGGSSYTEALVKHLPDLKFALGFGVQDRLFEFFSEGDERPSFCEGVSQAPDGGFDTLCCAQSRDQRSCICCYASGFPQLIGKEAIKFADEQDVTANFRACAHDGRRAFPCGIKTGSILAWGDMRDFIEVFVSELKRNWISEDEAMKCSFRIAANQSGGRALSQLLVVACCDARFVKRRPADHRGGRATVRLAEWGDRRGVDYVAFRWPNGEWEALYHPDTRQDVIGLRDQLWQVVEGSEIPAECFAYAALFHKDQAGPRE